MQCLQSTLYQTNQSTVNKCLSRIQNVAQQTIWGDRSRVRQTVQLQAWRERRRKVVCYYFHLYQLQKTLHKTLPRSHLSYEVFEAVLVDVERNLTIIPHPPWRMFNQKDKHDPVGTKCVSSGRHWRLRGREANKDDQATRRCWRPRIEMLDKKVHVRPSGKPQA